MNFRQRRRWSTGWVPPVYYNPPFVNPQWTYPYSQPNWYYPTGHPPLVEPYASGRGWRSEHRAYPSSPGPHLELNKLLGGRRPTAIWDVAKDPTKVSRVTSQGTVVPVPAQALDRPATYPAVRHMHIGSESFPWATHIDIPDEDDEDLSVRVVFDAIHAMLQKPLTIEEWRQESYAKWKVIFKAMLKRLEKGSPVLKAEVLRIDCLLDKTMFGGLKPVGPNEDEWSLSLGILRDTA